MSISNEKLLLISALAYYEELSDRHVYDDNIDDDIIKVNDVLDRIIKDDKTTCFDGAFGYSDSELGMDKIIALIRSDEELLDLEIIYPEKENDATTSSVCLVNPATQDVYVVYVGNYAEGSYTYMDDEGKITDIDSWVNNGQGATLADTDEQKRDLDLYIASINAVREYLGDYEKDLNITVCGHSTGGNHAQYVTITYPESDEYTDINDIDRCVSFDGQGFSEAFLEKYSSQISNRADKITSYCPTVSIVGALLNTIPGINQKYIDIGRPDALGIGLHMPAELINDEGEFKIEGYPSMEYQLLNAYSSWVFKIADMIPGIDVDNASNGFGEFLALIVNSNDIRDVGDAITILSTNKDAMAVTGVLLSEITVTLGISLAIPEIPIAMETFNEIQNTTYEMIEMIEDGNYDLAIEKCAKSVSKLSVGYYLFTMGMSTGNPVLGLTGFIVGYYGGEKVYEFGDYIGKKIDDAFDEIGDYLYKKINGIKKLVHYNADPLVLVLRYNYGHEMLNGL